MRQLNVEPKAELLARSNFGSDSSSSCEKMREALALIREMDPDLEIDGEMHGDCALDEDLRRRILPHTTLTGSANLLICPSVDAANISYNLRKTESGCHVSIGPFVLGANAPAAVLTSRSSVRRIINMTALTVVDANKANQ